MRRHLALISVFVSLNLIGQEGETSVQSIEPSMSIRTYVRPLFLDSTLLFYSDSLVWNCSMNDGYSYSYYEVDFLKVDSCICYQEVYQKLPAKGQKRFQGPEHKYRYELVSQKLKARLSKESSDTFSYEEYDEMEVLRKETLLFEWDNVLAIDSMYGEDNQRRLGLTVTKLIQVQNE